MVEDPLNGLYKILSSDLVAKLKKVGLRPATPQEKAELEKSWPKGRCLCCGEFHEKS